MALKLTRKESEGFTLFNQDGTEQARIRIVDIGSRRIGVVIDAPQSTRIIRNELLPIAPVGGPTNAVLLGQS